MSAARERAVERVEKTAKLNHYSKLFLADWPEGEDHFRWVAEAPIAELIEWAQTMSVRQTAAPEGVGTELRTLRRSAGLSQSELAERLGVSQPRIAEWEGGKRRPSRAAFVGIVAAIKRPGDLPRSPESDGTNGGRGFVFGAMKRKGERWRWGSIDHRELSERDEQLVRWACIEEARLEPAISKRRVDLDALALAESPEQLIERMRERVAPGQAALATLVWSRTDYYQRADRELEQQILEQLAR